MAHREFLYVAIVPLDCGHPDGSIHHYDPGDYIEADILGRAIGPLVLADKVARLIINVDDADGPAVPEQPAPPKEPKGSYTAWEGGTVAEEAAREQLLAEHEQQLPDDDEAEEPEDLTQYPHPLGGGLFRLSDGSTVRGRARALEAQGELN